MKKLLSIFTAILLMAACSQGADDNKVIVDPDQHPVRLNTGELLSMDGAHMHLAFTYDPEGRVVFAERADTSSFLVKRLAEYKYDGDRIYIKYQEFAELPNGEHDSNYTRDLCHYDTLFLVNGRADSLAGYRPRTRHADTNNFFFKFRYNERGELISIRNDNVKPYAYARFKAGEPWYTELYMLEWQDGNISKRTCTIPQQNTTTKWTYHYSTLIGSMPGSDPRNFIFDLVPLFSAGLFGTNCRNLMQSVESDDLVEQIEYQQDERQMVSLMKSNVTFNDGVSHDYAYNIKWAIGN